MTKSPQLDICFTDIRHRLAGLGRWPDQGKFPLNLLDRSVREQVLQDIKASCRPPIVTGFASLDRIIDLLTDDGSREGVCLRLLLGNEPFESRKKSFAFRPLVPQRSAGVLAEKANLTVPEWATDLRNQRHLGYYSRQGHRKLLAPAECYEYRTRRRPHLLAEEVLA